MQKGTVLYLSDAKGLPAGWEPEQDLARAGMDPCWTELAALVPGFYSPQEAQLRLAERGAGRIEGASAHYAGGRLHVGGTRVRLWG